MCGSAATSKQDLSSLKCLFFVVYSGWMQVVLPLSSFHTNWRAGMDFFFFMFSSFNVTSVHIYPRLAQLHPSSSQFLLNRCSQALTYELGASPDEGKKLEVIQSPHTLAPSWFHSVSPLQVPHYCQIPAQTKEQNTMLAVSYFNMKQPTAGKTHLLKTLKTIASWSEGLRAPTLQRQQRKAAKAASWPEKMTSLEEMTVQWNGTPSCFHWFLKTSLLSYSSVCHRT